MANPQLEGEPQSAAEGSVTNTAEGENAGGYQPRPQYNRYNQGGYNNNGNHYNNNRQGGYNNNRPQGGYNNRQGGYSNNRQGGYNNNRQGGYNNNRPQGGYNNNRPQGGYNNNGNHYNNNRQGGYNNNRQGGYNNNRQQGFKKPNPRQNQYGMPQGGRSFTPRPRRIEYEVPVPDPNEQIRLNKFMANAGLCSRREADEYIQQGLIKVNGEVVTELGTKISHNDVVEYNDKVVTLESKCYILLNKPKDCVTTSDDPNGRLTVMDLVKGACEERIYPVGRLDRNTTGVLLLTNDGDLASKLTHPKFVKKKSITYGPTRISPRRTCSVSPTASSLRMVLSTLMQSLMPPRLTAIRPVSRFTPVVTASCAVSSKASVTTSPNSTVCISQVSPRRIFPAVVGAISLRKRSTSLKWVHSNNLI